MKAVRGQAFEPLAKKLAALEVINEQQEREIAKLKEELEAAR